LTDCLRHPDAEQRAAAAWSVGELAATQSIPALLNAWATEPNRSTRAQMRTALKKLRSQPPMSTVNPSRIRLVAEQTEIGGDFES